MIVVFGIQGGRLRKKRTVLHAWCSHCEEPRDLCYGVSRRFASLFLVPVVPFRRRHWLACPECERGYRLDRAQRRLAQVMADLTERAQRGEIAAADYDRVAGVYVASEFTTLSPDPPDIAKTCGRCAASVAPEDDRCPACGQPSRPWSHACGLWIVSDDEGRTFASHEAGGWERVRPGAGCPQCGATLTVSTRRCGSCGSASRTTPVAV